MSCPLKVFGEQQIEVGECLLSFGAESFVFQFIIQKGKDQGLQNYNFACFFENMVLRRVFGPKIDSVRGEWRRLHNKELHALYFSPNINRAIKSKIMK